MDYKPNPYPWRESSKPEDESIESSVMWLLGWDLQNEPSQSYKDLKHESGVLSQSIGQEVNFEKDVEKKFPTAPF